MTALDTAVEKKKGVSNLHFHATTKMTTIKTKKRQFVVCLHNMCAFYRTGLNCVHHIETGESQDSLGQRWSAEAESAICLQGVKKKKLSPVSLGNRWSAE